MIKTSTPKNVMQNTGNNQPSKLVLQNIVNYSRSIEIVYLATNKTPMLLIIN